MCKLSPKIIGAALTATTCDERFIARLTKIISGMDNCDDVLEALICGVPVKVKSIPDDLAEKFKYRNFKKVLSIMPGAIESEVKVIAFSRLWFENESDAKAYSETTLRPAGSNYSYNEDTEHKFPGEYAFESSYNIQNKELVEYGVEFELL